MTVLHFTLPHQTTLGGLYVSQNAFRKVSGGKIVEIFSSKTLTKAEGDYQVKCWGLHFLDKNYGIPYGFSLPINIPRLFYDLNKLDVDLVIIHSLFHYHSIIAYWFAKKYDLPYIFVPHGTLDPYVFSYNSYQKLLWMKFFGKSLIENADSVVCSTTREAEKASKILKKAKVDVCNWGVEVPELSNSEIWKSEIRSRLGIASEEKVLLYLGRINAMKRPLETALAFQSIRCVGWKLIIVGYPEDENLLNEIQSRCDQKWVKYHPPLEGLDKWKLLAASDALVNLSHRENFGRSVVEAAAIGLPVLISDGVDIYPEFQAYNAAKIVSIESQVKLEEEMHSFLNLPTSYLEEMGHRGKLLVSEKFTETAFHLNLKHLIDKYAKRKTYLSPTARLAKY